MNQREAREVLAQLTKAFRVRNLDEVTTRSYVDQLERFPLDVGMLAVSGVIADHKDLPDPATLRAALKTEQRRLEYAPHKAEPPAPLPIFERENIGLEGVARARAALAARKVEWPDVNDPMVDTARPGAA